MRHGMTGSDTAGAVRLDLPPVVFEVNDSEFDFAENL